jgi:dUTP pyrophosphatase
MLKIEYLNTFDPAWGEYTAPTNGNACFDLRSTISYVLAPGERILVPLGIKTSFPPEYELQLRPRSGLALKHGISFVNCVGTVDSSYRGELGVVLINHGDSDFIVNRGDRIAQAMLSKLAQYTVTTVESVEDDTDRGGGFGSTGTR